MCVIHQRLGIHTSLLRNEFKSPGYDIVTNFSHFVLGICLGIYTNVHIFRNSDCREITLLSLLYLCTYLLGTYGIPKRGRVTQLQLYMIHTPYSLVLHALHVSSP